MAESFKDSGYATAMFGKWHLGDNYPYRPYDRGFEQTLWHKAGGVGQTPDYFGNTYFEDTYFRNGTPEKQYGYCTDVFTQAAEEFIIQSKESGKPFFCYLSFNAPHGPYNVDERYAAPFRGNPNIVNPEFYGMISNVDENVGRLRDMLKRQGLDENTVIIFLGDNGTAAGATFDKGTYVTKGYNGGLRGKKASVYEGGHRQALLMHIPGRNASKNELLTANIDLMPTLIDLCDLTPSKSVDYHGVNILDNFDARGRVFVTDTQRKNMMEEDRQYCVARDDWRLINGNQLYDMSNDREQRVNVASKHPEIVKELTAEYKKWWALTSVRADQTQNIPLVVEESRTVKLCCHDLFDAENRPNIWNFGMLHTTAKPAPGAWCVSLEKPAKVQIDAFRWSPESGIALGDPAPEGRYIPNGEAYPAGGQINDMVSLTIKIDGKVIAQTKSIDLKKPSATIPSVKLPAGEYKLQILFANDKGEEYSPWYVTVTR